MSVDRLLCVELHRSSYTVCEVPWHTKFISLCILPQFVYETCQTTWWRDFVPVLTTQRIPCIQKRKIKEKPRKVVDIKHFKVMRLW